MDIITTQGIIVAVVIATAIRSIAIRYLILENLKRATRDLIVVVRDIIATTTLQKVISIPTVGRVSPNLKRAAVGRASPNLKRAARVTLEKVLRNQS